MRRRSDLDGYLGIMRLFLLALVLAFVLWWAVATSNGQYRSNPKRTPRVPDIPPPRSPRNVRREGRGQTVAVEEVILIDAETVEDTSTDILDDDWPDLIDA